jgi:hypothetical protein
MPVVVRKDSNLSEDSNDPKRRKNVLGDLSVLQNPLTLGANGMPLFGQAINEEPFQSDDDMSSHSGTESKNKTPQKELEEKDTKPQKSKTNFFFVHKKVKNNRSSILADRPLEFLKTNTKKDSIFRFFSPPPPMSKKIEQKTEDDASMPQIKSNRTVNRNKNISLSNMKRSPNKAFKKVTINFNRNRFKIKPGRIRH